MKFNKMYLCETCVFVFQLHSPCKKKVPFCPNCGSTLEVTKYQVDRNGTNNVKLRWKEEEMSLIQECIKGKLAAHQVAILTGRSINSVLKKIGRVKGTTS